MSASTTTAAAPAAKQRGLASIRARLTGRSYLAIPALGYLCLALPMAALTKPWTNNDEPSHVAYIQYLLAHHAFPPLNVDNGVEAHQPPLYYLLGAVWQRIAGVHAFAVPEVFVSEGRADPQRYGAASHEADWTVYWLRGLSVGLGLAVVIAATVAAALIFERRRTFVVAGGLTVALWPKFLVVATSVTNDVLVDALCAWFFVGVVVLMRRGRPAGRRDWIVAGGTGVVGGLAVLSKFTAIPLVVLGVLILGAGIAADRRSWPNFLVVSGAATSTCSWWLIRNAHRYGDPLATHATEHYLKDVFHGALVRHVSFFSDPQRFVHLRWPALRRSLLYDGGWNQLAVPHWVDTLFW
ncbi:MAG TPA: hypothetical protein VKQ07_05720, partial [Jatrophihabitantaceae bacterium]|nr:hypothetical protein [Jatrophihabitantaceae bacterium]